MMKLIYLIQSGKIMDSIMQENKKSLEAEDRERGWEERGMSKWKTRLNVQTCRKEVGNRAVVGR